MLHARVRCIPIACCAIALLGIDCPAGGGPAQLRRPPVARRRAALFSAYFHALGYDRQRISRRNRPMPLDRAVGILLDDAAVSPLADARRRRVTVRLALGGLRFAPDREPVLRFRSQVARLSPVPVERIEESIRTRVDRAVASDPTLDPSALPRDLLDAMADELFGLLVPSPVPLDEPCLGHTMPKVVVKPWQTAQTTCEHADDSWKDEHLVFIQTELEILRPVDALARAIDPQSWDECSDYFEQAFTVEPVFGGPSGAFEAKCGHSLGSAWSDPLFEKVVFDPNPGDGLQPDAIFSTILDITSVPGPDDYEMRYCLRESRAGIAGSTRLGAGDIEVDEGFARAEPAGTPGWQKVTATKMIRFAPDVTELNVLSQVWAYLMGDEIAVGACCEPTDPDPVCS